MSHTKIVNRLPYQAGVLHLMDCDGAPVAVAVIKATFDIGKDGLHLAEQQQPLLPAGKAYGEPGTSSFQYEPECAYYKPATDVVLVGAAVPPSGPAARVNVEFSVGTLRKSAVVFGDRYWVRGFAGPYLSSPEPFESMPLVYERAFGGWDRSDSAPERHSFEPRNPVGTGFARRFAPDEDRLPLPNIEDPGDLISDMRSRPKPMGFGFVNPDWQPRADLAGSYDDSWTRDRAPLPPADFDRRFFNGASEGLTAEARLRGNETVELRNCAARPYMIFNLPGVPPPLCRFQVAGRLKEVVATELDTVVINTLENLAILTWRCHLRLPRGPESLLELCIKGED